MATATPECIDAYIANSQKKFQLVLEILRKTIKEVATRGYRNDQL